MSAQSKRWLLWLLLGGLLFGALTMLFWPRAAAVDLAVMSPGTLVVTVDEEGETRIRDTFVLSAPVTGHMKRVEVEVGDSVAAGNTVVAEIEPIDPTLLDVRTWAQAEAAVHAAEAAQELALANLAQAQAEVEFNEAELKRAQQLFNEKIIPIRDLDAAQRNARTSRAALNTVTAALDVSRFDLESARAQLLTPADSDALREGCTCVPVTASIDGQVLQVLRRSEGIVRAGEPLLELGDTADLEIVVDLLSTDAVKVQPRQRVIISDWGGDGELTGSVERVEPYAYTKVSALGIEEQRVNVVINLNTPYEKRVGLGHGYKLETSIVLWEGEDTLAVPLTALFRSGDQWALFVEENGRAVQRHVVIGRKTGLVAEVVDGLSDGERIVLYPSDRIQDSSRIVQRETNS